MLDIDPDKLTPAQLDVIANHLLKQLFADHPEAIPEARRGLEAGDLLFRLRAVDEMELIASAGSATSAKQGPAASKIRPQGAARGTR